MANDLRARNAFLSFWLWIAIIANIIMTGYYAVAMFNAVSGEQALGIGLCSMLGLLNILGAILLLRWNKMGFYMFVVSALMSIAINLVILKVEPVLVYSSVASIFIWWILLKLPKNGRSAWSHMRGGWDYLHCRHLYQVFSVCGIILFVLTMINAGKSYDDVYEDVDIEEVPPYEEDEPYPEDITEPVVMDSVIIPEDDIIEVPEPIKEDRSKDDQKGPQPSQSQKPQPTTSEGKPYRDEESKKKAADEILNMAIKEAQNEFPLDAGMGIILTRLYLSGDHVMYVAECDEDLIEMSLLEQNRSEMIKGISAMIRDNSNPEVRQFAKICANAGKGIGFIYVGDTSGKKVTVKLSNAELKRLI